MKKIVWLILIILVPYMLYGQEKRINGEFMIVFYNVENLFDISDNNSTLDDEFTPTGEKQWTGERYQKKLDDLSKVLSSIDKKNLPAVIGLCEVENRDVLSDLISTKKMNMRNISTRLLMERWGSRLKKTPVPRFL